MQGKRGNAELVLFAAVAIIALGGLLFVSLSGGISGMAAKPYIYDWKNMQYGTLNEYYEGITATQIADQHGDYYDCRFECIQHEYPSDFNRSSRRPPTQVCMDDCAAKYGQPPWGYAEPYYGPSHYKW
jgi:hypothetical protein